MTDSNPRPAECRVTALRLLVSLAEGEGCLTPDQTVRCTNDDATCGRYSMSRLRVLA